MTNVSRQPKRVPVGDRKALLQPVFRQFTIGSLLCCGGSILAFAGLIPPWLGGFVLGPMGVVIAAQGLQQWRRVNELFEAIGTANPQALPVFNSGLVLLAEKDYRGAEACFRQALDYDETFAAALNNLGIALLGQHRRDEALQAWEKALSLVPKYPDARRNWLLARAGKSLPE